MKPIIKWLNTAKIRKTLSINGFKEDIICPAHSLKTTGFTPYIAKKHYDESLNAIRMALKTENLEHLLDYLKSIEASMDLEPVE